jgi:hypothetical protein
MNIFIIFIFFNSLLATLYYYKKNFNNIDNVIKYLFRSILKFIGYNVEPFNLDEYPSKLIIIGSHTSIYDFFIGTIIYYAYLHEKYDTYTLMKKEFEELTTPFLTYFDSKFKLISVDTKEKGLADQICNNLKDKDNFILFIAPEGTRKHTESLRSGYWVIAKTLNINVAYLGIDFSDRVVILEKSRNVKDLWEEEQQEFIKSCRKYIPLYPERCFWTKDFYDKYE